MSIACSKNIPKEGILKGLARWEQAWPIDQEMRWLGFIGKSGEMGFGKCRNIFSKDIDFPNPPSHICFMDGFDAWG
ncbi:MAG: hypothetical protein NPINA01_11750 [Nitrospinaceae bacterium]|nr:MAG: hypothetical protein NPINA01_11750 [Nitrospinaceae bacterium]